MHRGAAARILPHGTPKPRASASLTDATPTLAGPAAAPAAAARAGYRREIDGLRAVAVVPVILFHAGFAAFAGGYLGVDVFFVISGYLITGILARDLARGRFSLARFYERRARRILPALAFVLLACLPVAVGWLSPPELRDFAASFAATALSVSNFVFWQELDYFGPAAEHLPLLHTWSLGIEEQFYILFPLALAALWRWRRRHVLVTLALALSLAAAAWAAGAHPSTGFFLLPFRAWELLVGALVALAPPPRPSAPLALAGLSVLGAAGLLTGGLAAREPLAVRAIRASVSDFNPWRDTCKTGLEQANPSHPVAGCLLDGAPGDPGPGVAFYGDSHADALQGAMFTLAKQAGLRFYSVTRSACPPVPGLTRTPGGNLRCDDFVRGVEAYVDAAGFGVVVLAARWTAGVAPGPFDNGEGGVDGKPGDFLTPVGATPADDADRAARVISAYVAAVENLLARGHRVVLVYPVPEAGWNVPEELARRREAAGHPLTLSTPLAAYQRRQSAVTAAFDAIESPKLYRVRPADLLCREIVPGRCVTSIGDQPLYFDDNHLNNTGALLVGERILAAIEAARRDAAGPG